MDFIIAFLVILSIISTVPGLLLSSQITRERENNNSGGNYERTQHNPDERKAE